MHEGSALTAMCRAGWGWRWGKGDGKTGNLETSQPGGAGVQVTSGDSSHCRGRRVRGGWLWATF